jgi:ATP-dependent DNA helicase RecQ
VESGAKVSQLMNPRDVLREVFGYNDFRGSQEQIIHRVIGGDDTFVLMPTGLGKSLCYQIPSIIRPGVGVVVSPLIALMHDQVRALHQLGVRAAFLNSTLSPAEASEIERRAADGALDLLYIAPERLLTNHSLRLLDSCEVALFAIDEAHCVSQWGHDFREEYLRLSVLHERFPSIPKIALTATADELTRREIVERLKLFEAKTFVTGFDRPNIRYHVVPKKNCKEQLASFLRADHPNDSGIVYCLSRKKTEETALWLRAKGWNALPYHAGMQAADRKRNQETFLRRDGVIIVATIAFGMGIDKPDVRFVAHLDLPKSVEAYYQETGRAGRDGLPADAFMTYGLTDVVMLRQFIDASEADEQHKLVERKKLDALIGFCETTVCRRKVMLSYFGDEIDGSCGNCDTCLNPPESWDGTKVARKALYCVSQTGQRFGTAHMVDILTGKQTDRIVQFNHDGLTAFGGGKELTASEWSSVFRQLVAMGLLTVDLERYGALKLTSEYETVMRSEREIRLRKDPKPERKRKRAKGLSDVADTLAPQDQDLFEALRELRIRISKEADVPPYVIFHDATLREMASARPSNLGDFAVISGVGRRKLEAYGEQFVDLIRGFGEER